MDTDLGPVSGGLVLGGIIFVLIGVFTDWTWIAYVGVVIFVAGILGKKFLGW